MVYAVTQINALVDIPDSWIKATMKSNKAGKYVRRLASRFAKGRKKN